MVSYMCQSQLSSDMLPSEAPMPPCAATVCERVGNTFDSTATDRPASASCSDARIPEPPAPTMSASKRRTGSEASGRARSLSVHATVHKTWMVQPTYATRVTMTATCSARRTPTGFT